MKRLAALSLALAVASTTALSQDSISARLGQLRPNDIVITNVDGFVSTTTITGAVERAVGDALDNCVKYDDLTALGLTNKLGSAAFETPADILSGETDPVFRSWSETNRYVKVEDDPVFSSWSETNRYVKAEEDPVFGEWAQTNNLASKDYVDSHMPTGFLPVQNGEYGTNTAFIVTNLLQVGENDLLVSSPTGVVTLREYAGSAGSVTGVKGSAESTFRTGNVSISKEDLGLGNVDNTSDIDKPVSYETARVLDKRVYVNEPLYLSWIDFDHKTYTYAGEYASPDAHLTWRIPTAYGINNWLVVLSTNIWSAYVDDELYVGQIDSLENSVTFNIHGTQYPFNYHIVDILGTVSSKSNPHNVTGQQLGVLNPSGKIFTNLVVNSSIVNGAVTGAKISENTIQASKIMNKTLIPSKFNSSQSVDWTPVSGLIGRSGLYIYGDDKIWYKLGISTNHEFYVSTVATPPIAYYNDIPDSEETQEP